jgi:hypothetical protein
MNIKNWSRLLPALVLEMSLGSDSNRLRRAILLTPFIFTQKEGFSSQDLLLNPCIILNQELLLSPENLDGTGPARAIHCSCASDFIEFLNHPIGFFIINFTY